MATIQGIYVAVFGRPADPAGLAFWTEATNGGQDLSIMLDAVASSEEYQARFAGQSETEIVTSIYRGLFNRDPDPEGLAFFVDALASGSQTLATIAVSVLDGAQQSDLTTVTNKVAAAEVFTASLDTPEKIAAYVGPSAAETARQLLVTVTEDPASVPTAETVATVVERIVEESSETPGNPETPPTTPPTTPPGGDTPGDITPPPSEPAPAAPSIMFTEIGNLLFGTALPGSTVTVYRSVSRPFEETDTFGTLGTAIVDSEGNWTFEVTDFSNVQVLSANTTNAGGTSAYSNGVFIGTDDQETLRSTVNEHSEMFGLGGNDDLIGGPGSTVFVGGAGNDTITGVGLNNTVLYIREAGDNGVTVNLATGEAIDTYGNTDTLNNIQRVAGTNRNDIFVGNEFANTFRPFAGNDTADGGGGFNEISYGNDTALLRVIVDLSAVENQGRKFYAGEEGAEIENFDQITNFQSIRGSHGNDVLIGNDDDNRFRGLEGADEINGGDGINLADYSMDAQHGGSQGIIANLTDGTIIDGFDDTDTVTNIQNVRGTQFNDVINGDNADNYLDGNDGNDVLNGGGGNDTIRGGRGDDTIDGGTGNNTVDYLLDMSDGAIHGIVADLSEGSILDGYGDTDTVFNIQNVIGTDFSDLIVGDTNQNILNGAGGDDILDGFGGSDTLTGGSGNDIFVFSSVDYSRFDLGPTVITDFRANGYDDRIYLEAFVGNATGTPITAQGALSGGSLAQDVALLIGKNPGANFAALLTDTSGGLDYRTLLIIDDGSGSFEIENDLVIELFSVGLETELTADWFYRPGEGNFDFSTRAPMATPSFEIA
jgi:Ca2+-binding RTX toxin-like protein